MTLRDKLAALHERATGGTWMASPYSSVLGRGIVSAPEGRMIGSIVEHNDVPGNAALIALLCSESARAEILAMMDERDRLREALAGVVRATRAYLPPDGIGAQACLNRILAATDNPEINPAIFAALGE